MYVRVCVSVLWSGYYVPAGGEMEEALKTLVPIAVDQQLNCMQV